MLPFLDVDSRTIREYDDHGELLDSTQLLNEHGFKVGDYVCRRKDKLCGTITAVWGTAVSLKVVLENDECTTRVIHLEEFLSGSSWSVITLKKEAKELEGWWPNMSHPTSFLIKCKLAEAKVVQAMDKLVTQKSKNWVTACSIFAKPRMVKAKCDLDERALVLVPSSYTIGVIQSVKTRIDKASKNALWLNVENLKLCGIDDIVVNLGAVHVLPLKEDDNDDDKKSKRDPFIVPYWEVQPTKDAKEANMKFEWMAPLKDTVAFPVLVNNVAIAAGQELKFLETDWPKKPEAAAAAADAPNAASAADAPAAADTAGKRSGTSSGEPVKKPKR